MRPREDLGFDFERLTGKISTERLRPAQLVFAEASRWTRFYTRVRRLSDIAMAFLGLLLALPLMIVTAIAIKLESRGAVIYTQERAGLHNTPFKIFKFRSMRTDAEANGPAWAGAILAAVSSASLPTVKASSICPRWT